MLTLDMLRRARERLAAAPLKRDASAVILPPSMATTERIAALLAEVARAQIDAWIEEDE